MNDFGVSFSTKYANELGIEPQACLKLALADLKVRRLRLMSYWDMHEPQQGRYSFKELDWQFGLAKKYNAKVSLSLGLRQPRWPESHWPDWAYELSEESWQPALLSYIEQVVKRYKSHPCLESWQLENEALLKSFGQNGNFNRRRLHAEYDMVKSMDDEHPIIMTTSDSWGIPIRGPMPDMFGISIYRRFYDREKYRYSRRTARFYKLRARLITLLTGRPVFIHELQAEPWGPKATSGLTLKEQALTMTAKQFTQTVEFAKQTELLPAYLWGTEWWYWLMTKHNDDSLWQNAKQIFHETGIL